jgi:hypothetical protein
MTRFVTKLNVAGKGERSVKTEHFCRYSPYSINYRKGTLFFAIKFSVLLSRFSAAFQSVDTLQVLGKHRN